MTSSEFFAALSQPAVADALEVRDAGQTLAAINAALALPASERTSPILLTITFVLPPDNSVSAFEKPAQSAMAQSAFQQSAWG